MKYLFYIVIALIVYRSFFGQKIIVEHRYKPDRRSKKPNTPPTTKGGDYVDYEEIK